MNRVVVGGGLSGILTALLLRKRTKAPIYLVEASNDLGGLLKSYDYGEWGKFDQAARYFYETGITELDELIVNAIGADNWVWLEGNRRDLAGVYFNDQLQSHSPFVDLNNFSPTQQQLYLGEIFTSLSADKRKHSDASSWFTSRFGESLTKDVFSAITHKIYGEALQDLDVLAGKITPLSRVVSFGEAEMVGLMESEIIRERFAYPEQRRLPDEFVPTRKSFYPKQFGIGNVVNKLEAELQTQNVKILKNAKVMSLEQQNGVISEIGVSVGSKVDRLESLGGVFWTVGVPILGNNLGLFEFSEFPRTKRRITTVVNLVVDKELNADGLYYWFVYQAEFKTFRVTNYAAYCPKAVRDGQIPISVEFITTEGEYTDSELIELAISELKAMQALPENTTVLFSRAERITSGFPNPRKDLVELLYDISIRIRQLELSNLHLLGVLSEPDLFFQTEILARIYHKLNQLEY